MSILYIIDISKEYRIFTVLEIPEINKSHCVILHANYHTLLKSFVFFDLFMFRLYNMESEEDDKLVDEGLGTSGVNFSDDQGDNTESYDDHQGADTSALQESAQGMELVKKPKSKSVV